MPNPKSWPSNCTILDSEGDAQNLIRAGAEFSLEPKPSSGDLIYYVLHVKSVMDKCFDKRPFYPVGVRDLTPGKLPAWEASEPAVRAAYMQAARLMKKLGREDPLAARLEGTITRGGVSCIARLYHFPGVRQDGRDWVVLDIISPASNAGQSQTSGSIKPMDSGGGEGTGHGDGGGGG
jgi:hypothetical protein